MKRNHLHFLFLNVGHFFDHFFLLIFATAAALRLTTEWSLSYAELIPYATPGFIAFGAFAIPAGWLADKWSREGMMVIFFLGIGACSIFASFASTPLQIGLGLTLIGMFAAIYHPVGLAMVVQGRRRTGVALAVNGVFGNMGVASAALVTGFLIDTAGWGSAFLYPGIAAVIVGLAYLVFVNIWPQIPVEHEHGVRDAGASGVPRTTRFRVFAVIFFTTGVGGLIFQSTTFALPKVFAERLTDLAATATLVGSYAFLVFAVAAFAQLVVGYLVDRYPVRTVFAWVAILQAVFLAVMIQLTGMEALIISVAFMLVVFGQIPINDVLVGRMARSEWRARAYAFRYIITISVMASALPLIAWIQEIWGFGVLFGVLSVAALTIFAAVLCLPSRAVEIQVPTQ